MSWDDEDFDVALPPSVGAPAAVRPGADEEEDKTLTAKPAPTHTPAPAQADLSKPKHAARKADETMLRRADGPASASGAPVSLEGKPFSDPELEKLRQQELQVISDMEAARDSMGGDAAVGAVGFLNAVSALDFAAEPNPIKLLARAAVVRVADVAAANKALLITFLEEAMDRAADKLSSDDLKKLRARADAASIKKAQREKEDEKAKKKGLTTAKKAGLRSAAVEAASEYDFGGDLDDEVPAVAAAGPAKRYGADDEEGFM